MTRIRVNPQELSAIRQRLSTVQSAGNNQVANIGQVRSNLDWQVTSQQGIDERLGAVQRRLQNQTELMGQYAGFLNTVNDRFTATDRGIRGQAGNVLSRMSQIAAALRLAGRVRLRVNSINSRALASIATVGGLFGATSITTTLLTWVREWIARIHEERGGKRGGRGGKPPEFTAPQRPITPIKNPRGLSSRFGPGHWGVDILTTINAPVRAPKKGIVVGTGRNMDDRGYWLLILHPCGHLTKYMHLQRYPDWPLGHPFNQGDTIANAGRTGRTRGHSGNSAHVHFEVIQVPESSRGIGIKQDQNGNWIPARNNHNFMAYRSSSQSPTPENNIDPVSWIPELAN